MRKKPRQDGEMYSIENMIGGHRMSKESEQEAFTKGIVVGVHLHQERVIAAHERGEPIAIGDSLYYLQSSRERLEETLNRICQ